MTQSGESNIELHEPPLRLVVSGLRWDGDDWALRGPGAEIEMHSTDSGDTKGGELIRVLREAVVERVQALMPIMLLTWEGLEWDRPDSPTENDLSKLVTQSGSLLEAIRVLEQLSPQLIEEAEQEGDDDA